MEGSASYVNSANTNVSSFNGENNFEQTTTNQKLNQTSTENVDNYLNFKGTNEELMTLIFEKIGEKHKVPDPSVKDNEAAKQDFIKSYREFVSTNKDLFSPEKYGYLKNVVMIVTNYRNDREHLFSKFNGSSNTEVQNVDIPTPKTQEEGKSTLKIISDYSPNESEDSSKPRLEFSVPRRDIIYEFKNHLHKFSMAYKTVGVLAVGTSAYFGLNYDFGSGDLVSSPSSQVSQLDFNTELNPGNINNNFVSIPLSKTPEMVIKSPNPEENDVLVVSKNSFEPESNIQIPKSAYTTKSQPIDTKEKSIHEENMFPKAASLEAKLVALPVSVDEVVVKEEASVAIVPKETIEEKLVEVESFKGYVTGDKYTLRSISENDIGGKLLFNQKYASFGDDDYTYKILTDLIVSLNLSDDNLSDYLSTLTDICLDLKAIKSYSGISEVNLSDSTNNFIQNKCK